MIYTGALRSLYPNVRWLAIMDDSTAEKTLSTVVGWPSDVPKPTVAELEVAVITVIRVIKIAECKAEAQRRIYAILPQWKQANLTARGVELNAKMLTGGTLTQAEKDERTAGFALWEKVKAIRAASNLIEQDILASADPANFDVANSPRWPA